MRLACCLLLLAAPLGAWAASVRDDAAANGRGACVYSTPDAEAAQARPGTPPAPPRGTAHVVAPVAAASKPTPAVTHGGGGDGDSDLSMPRLRAPKWHSFLPGMFR